MALFKRKNRFRFFPQKTRSGVETVMVDGKYAGTVVKKEALLEQKRKNEVAALRINVEELKVEGFANDDEITEAVKTLIRLDDAGNLEALDEALASYRKSDFLKTNKAMEFLAAHRYEKTLPEGWSAEVVGQNNSHVPDIKVFNDKGEYQYCVEVKMPSSQALPIVLQKGEDGKWITPADADEYVTKRVEILNRPENLALYGGAEAKISEEDRNLMLDLFEEHLAGKDTKYLYVVNLDKKKDIVIDRELITEDERVSITLRTPRSKSSGSRSIGIRKFEETKATVLKEFKDSTVDLYSGKEGHKKRAFLYTEENLDSNSSRRHIGENLYISKGSDVTVKKNINGVVKEVYVYEIREKSAKPTEEQGYTSLGQLLIKVD